MSLNARAPKRRNSLPPAEQRKGRGIETMAYITLSHQGFFACVLYTHYINCSEGPILNDSMLQLSCSPPLLVSKFRFWTAPCLLWNWNLHFSHQALSIKQARGEYRIYTILCPIQSWATPNNQTLAKIQIKYLNCHC